MIFIIIKIENDSKYKKKKKKHNRRRDIGTVLKCE